MGRESPTVLGGVKDDIPKKAFAVPLTHELVGEQQQQPPSLGAEDQLGVGLRISLEGDWASAVPLE